MCTYSGIIYDGLDFSTQEVNLNFKIKVSGVTEGQKVHKLVGVSGLIELIGAELANTLLEKAFKSSKDKYERKLRRGLKVTFYAN
nr:MAG TPA: hypothetical protein [Caudoviricetes sp.]